MIRYFSAAKLVDEATKLCPSSEVKRAKECTFKKMVDIMLEIGNPTMHTYRYALSLK